jgi:Fic family protein
MLSKLTAPIFPEYLVTHPWLKFKVDLREAPASLWIMLGECASKCEHIAGVPLRPEKAKKLYQVYLVKGAVATTAIEGNTLTEQEVLDHINGDRKVPPSREYQVQEIQNIIDACNEMVGDVVRNKPAMLSPERLKELNKFVLRNLDLEQGIIPGEIRTYSVGILQSRYRGAPHSECDYLLSRLCEWLDGEEFRPIPDLQIPYAIIKAILAHLYLAWIHPFGDGNGRTARLLEFQILMSSGVPAPASQLLSNHYNLTRSEYYKQLDRTSKTHGDIIPFLTYAVEGMRDQLRLQIAEIQKQQFDVTWTNYVHEVSTSGGVADNRRKRLVLELTNQVEPVPLAKLVEMSGRVAIDYSQKSKTTLSRDLSALEKQGLIKEVDRGFLANTEVIKAFLPRRAKVIE